MPSSRCGCTGEPDTPAGGTAGEAGASDRTDCGVAVRARVEALIASISSGVPGILREVITLGRTLKKWATDVLAYFECPGTSNGPTEALNGRLEHLRGCALGFRSLTHYIARSLLKTGGFRPQLHPAL